MRPMKSPLSLVICLTVSLGMSGCGNKSEPEMPGVSSSLRILPTNASAVDYVLSLVDAERVVAIPNTVDDYANVPGLDAFGEDERFNQFSAEVLLSFAPDLIVASPWQGKDTIARVRAAGVRVFELGTVKSLDDINRSLLELGEELHATERAQHLVDDFAMRVAAMKTAAAVREPISAISYTNYGSGGWAAGAGTTADMVLGLAGIENLAAQEGRSGNETLDVETLLTWDPDWIVVSKPSGAYGATRAFLENEASLIGMSCLKSGQIAEVPAALHSTTSHFLVDAAEALVEEIDRVLAERDGQ
jgi:ABC-type Fe3+-hydroxamate transport system substrate-binding protein